MNNVAISLVTSQDRDNFQAINKISDNLTVVNTFVPAGKNEDGSYKKPANMVVRVTSKTEVSGEIKAGSHLDVEGFFAVNSYTNKEGRDVATLQIVARKVTVKTFEEKAGEDAPAGEEGFIDIPEGIDNEVPFK